ncbi:hypothetical protein C8F01DRAFT_1111821 [Mycena amicta]|nr:hypothetical protein C8F01DRAFT_1111821 [Mycena amicta]
MSNWAIFLMGTRAKIPRLSPNFALRLGLSFLPAYGVRATIDVRLAGQILLSVQFLRRALSIVHHVTDSARGVLKGIKGMRGPASLHLRIRLRKKKMSLYNTTLVPAVCFGDSANGDTFNDLNAVMARTVLGPDVFSSDVARAIKEIWVMHSDTTIDGIQINYARSYKFDGTKDTVAHGTTNRCTDPNLRSSVFTVGDTESIVSISGTTGPTTRSGVRITSLSFVILDKERGVRRSPGPFGGSSGTAFAVNVTGEFIALSGFAIDTDKSLAQLNGEDGGLYGLVFDETNFKLVNAR